MCFDPHFQRSLLFLLVCSSTKRKVFSKRSQSFRTKAVFQSLCSKWGSAMFSRSTKAKKIESLWKVGQAQGVYRETCVEARFCEVCDQCILRVF